MNVNFQKSAMLNMNKKLKLDQFQFKTENNKCKTNKNGF